jgi:hypothetical protein
MWMVFTPVVNCEFYRRRAEDSGDMDGENRNW